MMRGAMAAAKDQHVREDWTVPKIGWIINNRVSSRVASPLAFRLRSL